jgi:hypothetical protein
MANKTNSKKEHLQIVPLERSERLIEAMQKAKIDLGLTPAQALQIIRPTNPELIRERVVATKNGKKIKAKYVPIRFFELKLISVFGWNWKFEIVRSEIRIRKDGKKEFIKTGRLWFKLPNGEWNYVERTGGAISREGVDDFQREKAAESDAFKRCCLALGFFADVYAPMLAMEDSAIMESVKEISENNGEEIVEEEEIPIIEEEEEIEKETPKIEIKEKGDLIEVYVKNLPVGDKEKIFKAPKGEPDPLKWDDKSFEEFWKIIEKKGEARVVYVRDIDGLPDNYIFKPITPEQEQYLKWFKENTNFNIPKDLRRLSKDRAGRFLHVLFQFAKKKGIKVPFEIKE